MKKVELTHAEVVNQYNENFAIKEFETEKGTVVNFQVKTRVNDRVDNSPYIFERCVYFADSQEKLNQIRKVIVAGTVLDIKGSQDKSSWVDKSGKKQWSDQLRIREITPVTINKTKTADDNLPF